MKEDETTIEETQTELENADLMGANEAEVADAAAVAGDETALTSAELTFAMEEITIEEILGPIGIAFQVIVLGDMLYDIADWDKMKQYLYDQFCIFGNDDPFDEAQAACKRGARRSVQGVHIFTKICHEIIEYTVNKPTEWVRAHAKKQYHTVSGTGQPQRVLQQGYYDDINIHLADDYHVNLKHLIPREHYSNPDWSGQNFNGGDPANHVSWTLPFIPTNGTFYVEDMNSAPDVFTTLFHIPTDSINKASIANDFDYFQLGDDSQTSQDFPYTSDFSSAFSVFRKTSGQGMTFSMEHSFPVAQISLSNGQLKFDVHSETKWHFDFKSLQNGVQAPGNTHGSVTITKAPYQSDVKLAVIEISKTASFTSDW